MASARINRGSVQETYVVDKRKQTSEISALIEDYLAHCSAEGVKRRTIEGSYGYPLRADFLPFCEAQGVSGLCQVDSRLLDRYANELRTRRPKNRPGAELSAHTVHTYRKAVNQFLAWARESWPQTVRVLRNPKLGRLPRKAIDVLSRPEIDRMEAVADCERDKLIVRALAETGIRVSELVGITIDDIVERDGKDYLRVHGKGDKDRLVSIYEPLVSRLRRHAYRERKADEDPDYLFVTLKRIANRGFERLTASGVQQLIRQLGRDAGIKHRVYPHLLRHSYITQMVIEGRPASAIRKQVGHATTRLIDEVYTHLTPADTYDALAPAAALPRRRRAA